MFIQLLLELVTGNTLLPHTFLYNCISITFSVTTITIE